MPKTMIEIPGAGRPIPGHQLDWLLEQGVGDVVVSCGHLSAVVLEWLEIEQLPLRVTTVVESEPLGRGGGLKSAAAMVPHPDEPWFGLNADTSYEALDAVGASVFDAHGHRLLSREVGEHHLK